MRIPYKKIIVTGGAGFVGSHLAISIKHHYPSVSILCLDNLKRRGSELALPILAENGIAFRHADIRKKEDFEELSCDIMLECSADPSALAGVHTGLSYLIDTNLVGTVNCLEFIAAQNADIIFLSTSRVYPFDTINNLSFLENATRYTFNPKEKKEGISIKGINEHFPLEGTRTFYGTTKLCSEFLIKEYIYFKKIRGIINRCGVITGPGQMGKVDQGIIVFWLAAHMFNRPLRYIGWGGTGKQVRDFIHINDLFTLVENQMTNFDKYHSQTFNVGGGNDRTFSLCELTDLCQKLTKKRISITSDSESRPGDVRWYVSDISKISALSQWTPQKNLEYTLEEIATWIDKNRDKLQHIL